MITLTPTGSNLADATYSLLADLAGDLARTGEDVHAGIVRRLASATITRDASAVLDLGEVLRRLRDMRAPQHIRPRIERAVSAIAAVLAPWPADRTAQLGPGSLVRARVTVGDLVEVENLTTTRVDTLGCGCRRVAARTYDGRQTELLTGCGVHPADCEPPFIPTT